MGRAFSPNGEEEYILVGKLEGKRPLGLPRRSSVDIEMDLGGIGRVSVEWIDLDPDNRLVPLDARKFLSKCTIGGLSRRAQLHGDITLIF
jgi:hypothetical protein